MKKFSKLNYKIYNNKEEKLDKITLYKDDYFKIVNYEDWNIVVESDHVVIIPYLIESNEIIIRYEYIPSYKLEDGTEYHITVISGTIEKGEEPKNTVIRELEEEAGIVLRGDYQLDSLKPLFKNKGTTSKYYPYIINLSESDYDEVIPKGDGSLAEKLSKCVKINVKNLNSLDTSDLITDYMILKLKENLNLI